MAILSAIIDSREPDWAKKLTFGGVPVAVAELAAGDVLMATTDNCLLAVERKSPNDFLGSLRDRRLLMQAAAMRELTPWSYVVVTGELRRGANGKVVTDRETGWDWNAVHGELLRVQELGVFVSYCASDADFESAVVRLCNRNRGTVKLSKPPLAKHVLSDGENVIASLPGIGLERLEALMKHCGAPIWALVAVTDEELNGVPGVGLTTKQKIRRELGMPDWMTIELAVKEGLSPEDMAKMRSTVNDRWQAQNAAKN